MICTATVLGVLALDVGTAARIVERQGLGDVVAGTLSGLALVAALTTGARLAWLAKGWCGHHLVMLLVWLAAFGYTHPRRYDHMDSASDLALLVAVDLALVAAVVLLLVASRTRRG